MFMRITSFCAGVLASALAVSPALAMTLKSYDISPGATISRVQIYGNCDGNNVSPELRWSGAPAATKSFALTLYDPDAHGGWWHWVVFNIPKDQDVLKQNAGDPDRTLLPGAATEGTNDFGSVGYGGPCPPAGDKPHHYIFTLWALDTAKAPFTTKVTGDTLEPWLKKHAIATATLTGRYGR
jgi:Raf kinase inhibitor-like YbhB/YbcL family protein